jgi:hypothetical protein
VYTEEKTFNLRLSLEVSFPDGYDGEQDNYAWFSDWEGRIKGEVIRVVFAALRRDPSWTVHARNRGVPAEDEVEIVIAKTIA